MTHDFQPGDVVEWSLAGGAWLVARCPTSIPPTVVLIDDMDNEHTVRTEEVTLLSRPPTPWSGPKTPQPALHPSRERALLSLGAAREALEDAIDHLIKAGQPETVPGQCVVRTRTAAEGAQQCIQHATMAMYWLLHERLGS